MSTNHGAQPGPDSGREPVNLSIGGPSLEQATGDTMDVLFPERLLRKVSLSGMPGDLKVLAGIFDHVEEKAGLLLDQGLRAGLLEWVDNQRKRFPERGK